MNQEPQTAAEWLDRAALEKQCGNLAAAKSAYERSLQLSFAPHPALQYALILVQLGELQLAPRILSQITQEFPHFALAADCERMADAFVRSSDFPAAEAAFRLALYADPGSRKAALSLGTVLRAQLKQAEAEALAQQLVQSDPKDAAAWELLATAQLGQGDAQAAIESRKKAASLTDTDPLAFSRYLGTLQYQQEIDAPTLLREHVRWDRQAGQTQHRPFIPLFPPAKISAPLRVGVISGNLMRHPIAFLVLPTLQNLDRHQCQLFFYADQLSQDEFTGDFQAIAEGWKNISALSDDKLHQRIRLDRIDVLIDLMGHTGTRLPVFARKPAPIQLSWLGYAGTTGLAAMDYLLADPFHVRPGEEAWYTERILRFRSNYACYRPPDYAPSVGSLPALTTHQFTFGSFNNPAKLNSPLLNLWSEILERVPDSQLLLKYGGYQEPLLQQRVLRHFSDRGIDRQRILFESGEQHAGMLAAYNRIDLALDTQPYSGGLTTCEALWMGVPVVTYPGNTFAGRHSFSYLSNLGCTAASSSNTFIASNTKSYADLAVNWASQREPLSQIRSQLRPAMQQSPLCNYQAHADELMHMLKSIVPSNT